jgi:ribonucleoside-diphosphate reductase alpha chain
VRIGRIVEQNLVGLEIFDGTEDGRGTTRVVAVKDNGEKPVYRVQLASGAAIYATADHVVLCVPKGGAGAIWTELGQLQPGDKLVERVAIKDPLTQEAQVQIATDAVRVMRVSKPLMVVAGAPARPDALVYNRSVPVTHIDFVGVERVFDIQTESGQYVSNNVVIHNCFIQSVNDDLVNPGGIMDLWTREARLFKYGSGTGSNFSRLRGENEPLSGGGKSSGLMSFLKIGDRAAGAIKSGGTTRRAAKMVCLDLDHPDVEMFVNWKVREELKVAAMAAGMKSLSEEQQDVARRLGMRLDYDFNGEAYYTVSGQNSNNSVRIPNRFFKAIEEDGDWHLTQRTNGKISKTVKARQLWDQIAYAAWRCADPGVQYDDTINQWHTCPKSGRINASNPCVTGDTRVLTPGGIWRRIDQMIHLPSRVVTNLRDQQIHVTEGAFPTGTKDIYELRTAGGYSIKVTADHKVMTRTRGWVEAQHLTSADEIKLVSRPAAVQEIGEPQDPRFFQMLGLFVSGANNDPSALHLDACLGEEALVEEFGKYVCTKWADRSYDDDYVNELMVDTSDRNTDENGNTITATLTNRRLLSRLKAFVRNDNGQRRLSDEAFTAGLAAQKHLLRALFTADAVINDGDVELFSDSEGMLQDVQLLLLGFGVKSIRFEIAQSFDGGAVGHGGAPDRRVSPTHPGSRETGGALSGAPGAPRGDAAHRRHGLRIDPGGLRFFCRHVGLLRGKKLEQLARGVPESAVSSLKPEIANFDRVASFTHIGRQQVFDLTEPTTSSFVANGITVHNCSEYMFLDDTACNLASLNVLTFFDAEHRTFDVEGYKHAIRLWTIVLEISVLMASFPSEQIARLSYRFRTLGLGYANLGAMLMQAGVPYDSDKARAVCAALTAILTGESYATSAEMARELGAFPGFDENASDMLRIMRNHRRAAYDVTANAQSGRSLGQYEMLDIRPVGVDESQFDVADPLASKHLLNAARECWDRALFLGERHGYRNAQTTVIAPTGTIGLLMDCDTTGVEPDFALVKFKKLAGGGYFKIANQSLRPALVNLGYSPEQINDILKYVMGTLSLHDAPHINWASLRLAGCFTDDELHHVEQTLPGMFELNFAFSAWSVGADFFKRLEINESEWQHPRFNLLKKLGFTKKQIDEANDHICGRGTVEGAPHLKPEHYAVFDCANKCGKTGTRFIAVDGHIRMMAAAQPFISGAISKTINLPNEATLDDIKRSYELSWKLGLKANALYRDGSKLSQPLNIKSDEELDRSEEDDQDDLRAAREEVATDVAKAASAFHSALGNRQSPITSDNLDPAPAHTSIIEKIVERIVERPLRRRLPDTRNAITHKFDVAGHEGYITVGLYEDGSPGEVFITMAKEGSTIGGLMDTIATLVSVALQYGVPVESLVRKFEHVRFEPAGMTRNADIPMAKSLVDYIFRWLAMEFVPGYRAANAPKRAKKKTEENRGNTEARRESTPGDAPRAETTSPNGGTSAAAPKAKGGNGHGPRIDPDTAKPFAYDGDAASAASSPLIPGEGQGEGALDDEVPPSATTAFKLRTTLADPLSQHAGELQSDAPACDVCGAITVRSATCYKCLNCGNSMGCS